jgi:tRNA pseudouridine38-40 synthase
MRNFKIVLEYDGSGFHGWQVQPELRTVQGELMRAIEEVTGERSGVTGAGRTDAGVHAVAQVGSFLSATRLVPETLRRALNAHLPADIRIASAEEAPRDFNARFHARSRGYRYLFIRRRSALWRGYYHPVEGALEVAAMRRSLLELAGERDFTSFTTAEGSGPNKRCRVISAELIESPPLIAIAVTADHFLHKMMRLVAGTVLEIGFGKPWSMAEILESRDPARSGPALPPHALYLWEVTY